MGSVVGAGFATGQEVSLFFGKDGVWGLFLSALFMAVCAFSFLQAGARGRRLPSRVKTIADGVVSLSSFAVYAAMIAAAEEVLFGLTGQRGFSVFLAVGMIFLSGERTEALSALNLLAVPMMTAIVVLVGARAGKGVSGGFHPIAALCYGGMNLLFSGALLMKEGENATFRERVGASLVSGAVIFLMLYFMRRCVSDGGDMPFLIAAHRDGLGKVAQISLLLAIVTTMASCAYLSTDGLIKLSGDRVFAAGVVTVCGILISGFGFARIVKTTYPVVSYLGLALSLFVLAAPALAFLKKRGAQSGIPIDKPPPHTI